MTATRMILLLCASLAAWAAWPSQNAPVDNHRATRQFVIASTLARTDDAVVILGDSIVEASTPPRWLCGHPLVNAGIGGASTVSQLDTLLLDALAGKRAAMIIVALGTNDAAGLRPIADYRVNYQHLLKSLKPSAQHLAVLAVPPPEPGLPEADRVDGALIDSYNGALPALVREVDGLFIRLQEMPTHHTVDGIHLNGAGYEIWDRAVAATVRSELCQE